MRRSSVVAAAVVVAIGLAACGGGGTHRVAGDVGSPSTERQEPSSQQQHASASNLPPCASATATGCDRSKLGGSGSGSSGCVGKGPATITASPIAIPDLAYIQPMGLMIGGHVTPIDHGYFYIKGAVAHPPQPAAVYAPMDGTVTSVTRTVRNGDPAAKSDHNATATYDDYALTIEATCTFRVRFSNLVRLAGSLGDKAGQLTGNDTRTPNVAVKAGDLIGYTGLPTARGIDVWVENDDVVLTGFVNPTQYTAAEAWKTHMVDFFDATAEPLKSQLLALDERDASPRFGKIDHDVDGKLIGTWFRTGTGGYGGLQHGSEGYWAGHLSVVPDGNDPAQIDVSIGDYQGKAEQFAVIGNTPDPVGVSASTGLVKYELGRIEQYSAATGQPWDGQTFAPHIRTRAGSGVMGTVLLQLVDTRHLKVQVFAGKRAAQVSGFDGGASTYER